MRLTPREVAEAHAVHVIRQHNADEIDEIPMPRELGLTDDAAMHYISRMLAIHRHIAHVAEQERRRAPQPKAPEQPSKPAAGPGAAAMLFGEAR